jgi:predicted DCC family thiol-disulfide oxidoreductase YuxK
MFDAPPKPVLLFDGECAVCRAIGHWVRESGSSGGREPSLIVRPIGDDPADLRKLNAKLDIWDAYATIHVLMPDGSMKLGGEAVAEVFRNLPSTRWFCPCFAFNIFGCRPFAVLLEFGYTVLADVRPLLGCESCGTPAAWVKPIHRTIEWIKSVVAAGGHRPATPHFASLAGRKL